MSEPFKNLTAIAAPLIRENVDTDAIIPSREMKTVGRTGLAEGLFAGWRYTEVGGREENPDFVLNDPRYRQARILLGGGNFGCGSSREHAVWALHEYGFRAILAPSFNPIFRGNCVRNGIVPVVLVAADIEAIARHVMADPEANQVTVDLEASEVRAGSITLPFQIDAESHEMLLEGLDAIELTQRMRDKIDAFRATDRLARPWIYLDPVEVP